MLSYLFEAVLPIFAIGALGYFFGKRNIFDNRSEFVMNKFVMMTDNMVFYLHNIWTLPYRA